LRNGAARRQRRDFRRRQQRAIQRDVIEIAVKPAQFVAFLDTAKHQLGALIQRPVDRRRGPHLRAIQKEFEHAGIAVGAVEHHGGMMPSARGNDAAGQACVLNIAGVVMTQLQLAARNQIQIQFIAVTGKSVARPDVENKIIVGRGAPAEPGGHRPIRVLQTVGRTRQQDFQPRSIAGAGLRALALGLGRTPRPRPQDGFKGIQKGSSKGVAAVTYRRALPPSLAQGQAPGGRRMRL